MLFQIYRFLIFELQQHRFHQLQSFHSSSGHAGIACIDERALRRNGEDEGEAPAKGEEEDEELRVLVTDNDDGLVDSDVDGAKKREGCIRLEPRGSFPC